MEIKQRYVRTRLSLVHYVQLDWLVGCDSIDEL